jgi:hypothetical protein
MRQQFLTELMRVFPNTAHRGDSKVKIILSCRSHHFEDLKDKNQIATSCLLDEVLCISGYFLSP